MARDDVKASVKEKDWDTLLSADQLKVIISIILCINLGSKTFSEGSSQWHLKFVLNRLNILPEMFSMSFKKVPLPSLQHTSMTCSLMTMIHQRKQESLHGRIEYYGGKEIFIPVLKIQMIGL